MTKKNYSAKGFALWVNKLFVQFLNIPVTQNGYA